MNPTEALQREWDRQQVWPQRRWQARLLPLGKRLETPWAPREAGMEHVTFEPTAAFCTQLDGDQFEQLPLFVDHKRGRPVGLVERLFIRGAWLCASLRLDPDSSWFETLNSTVLGCVPYSVAPVSSAWEVTREGPKTLLENAVLATSALVYEVSLMFRSRARIAGAGVYAIEYVEPKPAPSAETPRGRGASRRRSFETAARSWRFVDELRPSCGSCPPPRGEDGSGLSQGAPGGPARICWRFDRWRWLANGLDKPFLRVVAAATRKSPMRHGQLRSNAER